MICVPVLDTENKFPGGYCTDKPNQVDFSLVNFEEKAQLTLTLTDMIKQYIDNVNISNVKIQKRVGNFENIFI